jgi:hypothetical protein
MSCDEVRRELERLGLLLLQDKQLPSVATIFAGGPISGSWWSHPRSHEMFWCLATLEEVAVVTRLVKGKVTYVHRRLWPALAAAGVPIEDEVHTASGRHEKRIEPADAWAKRLGVTPAPEGRAELETALIDFESWRPDRPSPSGSRKSSRSSIRRRAS